MPDVACRARRVFLPFVLLLVALNPGGRASAEDGYVLALSWHPAFCADDSHAKRAECRTAAAAPRLVLHGLWPDWDVNGDGERDGGDAFCVSGADNRKAMMALDAGNWLRLPPVKLSQATTDDLNGAMPGVATGLDRHEWWKHGTCSGLAAEDYFATATVLLRAVERGSLARLLADGAGGSVRRKQLLDAFEADFGRGSARALQLDCAKDDGVTALQEIRIRLKRGGIAQGLTADGLAIPAKPARGDCAADVFVPAGAR